MRRTLTNFATVVSLFLGVAVVALWVRSHFVMDRVSRTTTHGTALDGGSREWFIRSNIGELVFTVQPYTYHRTMPRVPDDGGNPRVPTPEPLRWTSHDADPELAVRHTTVQPPYGHNVAGFAYGRYVDRVSWLPDGSWSRLWSQRWSQRRQYTLSVPHWFVAIVFALPAVVEARRSDRVRRRRLAGLCAACGYDLRASAGRCPECGAVPIGAAASAASPAA